MHAELRSHRRDSVEPATSPLIYVAVVPNESTISERWFDEYLTNNGYTFEVEPDLGIRTRPDRLIERAGIEAVCEVKEFTTDAMNRRWPDGGSQVGAFSSEEWLLNVRRAISTAARQLEPLADTGRPLVIVLANPHGVIAELEGRKLMEAMHGDLMITMRINTETGEAASDAEWTLGAGGRLAEERAPWVSAVVGLHRGDHERDWMRAWVDEWKARNWPDGPPPAADEHGALDRFLAYQPELEEALARDDVPRGDYFYLDVVEAITEDAVPLPSVIFDGERDSRWVVDREAGEYRRTGYRRDY